MYVETKFLDDRLLEFLPQYATAGAAAADLRACTIDGGDFDRTFIAPGGRAMVGTGIAIHICDPNYGGLVLPRSGMGSKGITLGNSPGLIDPDYTGEIKLALWNSGSFGLEIRALDRLAQLLIVPIIRPHFIAVKDFAEATARGDKGFGSSGVR